MWKVKTLVRLEGIPIVSLSSSPDTGKLISLALSFQIWKVGMPANRVAVRIKEYYLLPGSHLINTSHTIPFFLFLPQIQSISRTTTKKITNAQLTV